MRRCKISFLTSHCNVCRQRVQVWPGLGKSFPKSEICLVKDALWSKEGEKAGRNTENHCKNVHEYEQLYRHVHTQSFANWSLSLRNKSIEKRCLRWYLQRNYFPANEFFDQEASAWLKQKERNIGPAACRQMLKLNWPRRMKILKLKISTNKKVFVRCWLNVCKCQWDDNDLESALF